MSSFQTDWLLRQPIDMQMAGQLREIGEHKGRAELYSVHTLRIIESLRQMTAEHSAAASSRMESVQNPLEQVNYQRQVLELQEMARKLPVEPATILKIHAGLFQDTGKEGGQYKTEDNQIVATRPDGTKFVSFYPVAASDTPDAMEQLCMGFRAAEKNAEPLLLIGTFMLDFLCIRPFSEANGRVAQLIALWLMNRHGYNVSRFVSVERIMESKKSEFYLAQFHAFGGWHQSEHDLPAWWKYWLEVVLASYREFTARARALSKRRGVKTEMVLGLIDSMSEGFTIRQIQQKIPGCGIELIRKVFKAEKATGRIQCLGRGPNALWKKKRTRDIIKSRLK